MAGVFELKNAGAGQVMFNLKAPNGEVILTSERYTAKTSATAGIAAVRANALIDTRYQRKLSSGNQPYFVLRSANGETLGHSEMYSIPSAMEAGIASVKTNAPGAQVKDLT